MPIRRDTPYFIINPSSGGGRARRLWPTVTSKIRMALGPFEFVFTVSHEDVMRQTHLALQKGFRKIISVGGDGTLNAVVNALMRDPKKNSQVTLGVFPLGTGDDFVKTLRWPTNPNEILQRLKEEKTSMVDVGKISFSKSPQPPFDKGGQGGILTRDADRYFLNIADFGLGGNVVQIVNNASKLWGAKAAYFGAIAKTLFTFRSFSAEIKISEKTFQFKEMVMGVVANGRYFSSGLCIAPEAEIADGLFDIFLVEKVNILDFLRYLVPLLKGEKIEGKGIHHFRSSFLEVQSTSPHPVFLQGDGEMLGELPVRFEVLPKALRMYV